jgi:hypothetical protein
MRQVREIREKRIRGIRAVVLAALFGVCKATIYYVTGPGWKERGE